MYVITNLYKQIATFFKIYQFQCCNLCPDFGQVQHLACLFTWRWGVKLGVFLWGFWPVVPLSRTTVAGGHQNQRGCILSQCHLACIWIQNAWATAESLTDSPPVVFGCVPSLRWDTISLPCWWMTVPFPKMPSSVFGKVLLRIRRCQRCGKIWLKAWGWNFEPLTHHMNRPNGWFMGRCKS